MQQQCDLKPAAESYLHKAHHGLTQNSKMNKLGESSGAAQVLYEYFDSESDEDLRGGCSNDHHFGNLPKQRVCANIKCHSLYVKKSSFGPRRWSRSMLFSVKKTEGSLGVEAAL